tara:strand:- start:4647 stop:5465 length:819 start_codon:yes stop_codon:yes gene_type:complete
MKNLVTTEWLKNNIHNVRILDASWHMPNANRDGFKEYLSNHIPNAHFFDLDKTSEQNSLLPHMLPKKEDWEKSVSNIGIKNSDHIIIYDNSDVISSCRIWYNFLYFGHNPNLVSVLDGGFKKWINEKNQTTNDIKFFSKSSYLAKENRSLVLNKNQIDSNIQNKVFDLVDARGKERFDGLEKETREGLRSGNIKGSKNIPFSECVNKHNHTFKNKDELIEVFNKRNIDNKKDVAFTCGSGVTACVLGLANSIISGKTPIVYDGSWAEYGKNN